MSTPEVVVEVGFTSVGTGTALHLDDTARGILDTATLAADDLFADVSQWATSVSTRRGATRSDGPVLRYEAGTATVVLRNEDRRFDPSNLDGPYVAGGVTQVVPRRPIRIRAVWDGVAYPLWRGYVDDWTVEYEGPTASTVVASCSDAFSVFASYDRAALGSAVGAGEDSGARIDRILDSVDWDAADRVIATGDSTVQGTTLADNTLTELYLTADSELGEVWMDAEGRVVFRNRHAVYTDSRSATSQATFGDGGGAELPYASVDVAYDSQSIHNLISIARVGGTAQVVEDSGSRQAYLTRTYARTDLLLETDAETADYAGFLLHKASEPELRFGSMLLKPGRDADLWPQALGREIGDRVTVLRRPPGGGDPIERDVIVRGVEHTITEGRRWETRFVFQSATRLSYLVLDDAILGQLDSNALTY